MDVLTTTNMGPANFSEPVRRRSKRRILVWMVGLIVIGGMGISVLLPTLCGSREPANRVKCASNLRQIGQAIMLYAQQNGGKYPPSLAMLTKQEQIAPGVMVCPSSNEQKASAADTPGIVAELEAAETNAPRHEPCLSYIYVGSRLTTATASDTTVVAYEPLENHNNKGTNVLFGDGHVEFIDKTSWTRIAAAAGVAAIQSLATGP